MISPQIHKIQLTTSISLIIFRRTQRTQLLDNKTASLKKKRLIIPYLHANPPMISSCSLNVSDGKIASDVLATNRVTGYFRHP